MAITFQTKQIKFDLPQKSKVKSWIKKIIALEKKLTGEITFVFTSDEELLKINKQFLKHNSYTDIITFNNCEGKTISGDIMISIERVEENARNLKTDPIAIGFKEEIKRVMIHGVLHLCGFKDKTKSASALMRKKENWALRKFK